MPLDRVVFDTNIWITYFYNGDFEELVQIVEDIEVRIYSCEKLEKEISAVLQRPKLRKKLGLGIERYISFLRKLSVEIELDERFDRVKDVKDNYIVDLAFASKCSHIVTGDPDLLSIKHVGNIQIISLAAFKKEIGKLRLQ